MIALVGLAMAADLLTFALAIPHVGIGAESNPVMVRAYAQAGLVMVVLLKALCTAAILLLVARLRRGRGLAAGIGVGFGLLGAAANLAAVTG